MPPQGKNKQKPTDPPPDDDPNEGGDDDGALTEAQTKQVLKLVNGAVSGQLARKLGPAIEAGMSPILAKLDELKGGKQDDEPGDDDDGDQPGKKKGKPDPAVTKMSKQLDAMQKKLQERDEQLAREADARKTSTVESALTKALSELGVDKNRMRGALAIHKGAASVDDDGNVVFKMKRDGYEEDLEPGAALKEWAGTDEGKSYLAPTGSNGGAGARAPRPAGPARKPAPSTPEAKAEKVAAAKTDLLGAVGQLVAGGSIAIE